MEKSWQIFTTVTLLRRGLLRKHAILLNKRCLLEMREIAKIGCLNDYGLVLAEKIDTVA